MKLLVYISIGFILKTIKNDMFIKILYFIVIGDYMTKEQINIFLEKEEIEEIEKIGVKDLRTRPNILFYLIQLGMRHYKKGDRL